MKSLTDAQYAFKAAVRRAVKMAGGCEAAADATRVDAPRLSRYGNIDAPEFAPIDVCFDLDKAAGDPVVLRAMADLYGFDLKPRDIDERVAADLMMQAGDIAKESGDLVSEAIVAASDGKLTPNEAVAIDSNAADLQGKIVELRATARRAMVGSR
jgi:hypothetical protein